MTAHSSERYFVGTARLCAPFLVGICAGLVPQVHAADHDLVITREVPARTAYRQGGQGPVRASADTSPDDRVNSALGIRGRDGGHIGRELSDRDFAGVVTGEGRGGVTQRALAPLTGNTPATAGASGGGGSPTHNAPNTLFGNVPGMSGGAVPTSRITNATGEIGNTLGRVLPGMR